MKKSVLAMAIASSTALSSFGALAEGPDFYGRVDLALTNSNEGYATQNQKDGTVFENNFSWLGVKGSEALSENIAVIYQMEFGVNNFDNSGDTFNARNTYVGLQTLAGTALVGRNDTVFKQSEGGFDLFGNTNADIDLLAAGQSRLGDGITYYSPKIANILTLNATYVMSDNYSEGSWYNPGENDEWSSNNYALSATLGDKALKAQNYYVAAAYNDGLDGIKAYRGVAQVKFGELLLGALYQNSEHVADHYSNLEGDTWFINAGYKLGNTTLKAAYGQDDSGLGKYVGRFVGDTQSGMEDVSDVDLKQYTVGADHRLSKNTLVYGHYTRFDGDMSLGGAKVDLSDDVVTLGLRVDF